MKFYRLATKEDFEDYEIQIDHFVKKLPREVEELIEEGHLLRGAAKLRQIYGLGIDDCKRHCAKYQAFIKAKEDFYNGKPVFTDY